MMLNNEAEKVIEYIRRISLATRKVKGVEYPVMYLATSGVQFLKDRQNSYTGDFKLILVDVCLAWRQPWANKVYPRIQRVEKKYSHITKLEELRDLIMQKGDRFNEEFWDFRSERRKQMLVELVEGFIVYKKKMHFDDDLEAMRHWAHHTSVDHYKRGINGRAIPYLGIANFQYLRMLCGVDTVKPDDHILRAFKDPLGYPKSAFEVVKLSEAVSRQMGVPTLLIDQMFWVYYAVEVPHILVTHIH